MRSLKELSFDDLYKIHTSLYNRITLQKKGDDNSLLEIRFNCVSEEIDNRIYCGTTSDGIKTCPIDFCPPIGEKQIYTVELSPGVTFTCRCCSKEECYKMAFNEQSIIKDINGEWTQTSSMVEYPPSNKCPYCKQCLEKR
jgi:hypothetical protein